jgi:redox-sensitive bicupin YhaK (pirin superfamily)
LKLEIKKIKVLYKTNLANQVIDQGKFKIKVHNPGSAIPDYDDHGYGPLATIGESFMAPDTWIRMHPHNNDEIISWVPEGVMRHYDSNHNTLLTDQDHIMIMNAGTEFWHEEKTLAADPPLRILQIFVRPYAINLPPGIQHGQMEKWVQNKWRKVFGPQNSGSAFYVRNDVTMYDLRVQANESVAFPLQSGYDLYFMVYTGEITVNNKIFTTSETGLLVDETSASLTALADSLVVAFPINPKAKITKAGTIGR